MLFFKDSSEMETKIQEIESFMNDRGITIFGFNLCIVTNGNTYPIFDIDSKNNGSEFPRKIESERIIIVDED